MAIQKRKAVVKSARAAFGGARSKGAKRPVEEAAAAATEVDEETEQTDAETTEESGEELSEEDRVAKQEQEIVAVRTKELKTVAAGELKELVLKKGLQVGNKEDNVAALLAAEAKSRADQREHEMRLRAAVVKKKEELEGLPFPELSEHCRVAGILGKLTKQERVQQLLRKWQQEDGINKALAAMTQEERHVELAAMDVSGLISLCVAAGVDPLLKEVMVDRLLKHESAAGHFARPEILEEQTEEATKEGKSSMVDAVLANEKSRKEQQELKRQRDEVENRKRKDLQGKSVDELKKILTRKGKEPSGKKDELVETLMTVMAQEEASAVRKAKLRAMSPDELRMLLASHKVEVAKHEKKDGMIEALFAQEAKVRKDLEAYLARAGEAETKKRKELQTRSADELKQMCAAKGLKLGTAKDGRIETLIEAARMDGEVDKLVAAAMRDTRNGQLLAMDKESLKALCDQAGVDTIVKDVVVERIVSHECEHGRITMASKCAMPPTKKARTSKK